MIHLSRLKLSFLISVGLLALCLVGLRINNTPINADLFASLLVEMIGAVLAFLLFTVLFEIHDTKKIEPIKKIALRDLGNQLYLTYMFLDLFCDVQEDYDVKENVKLSFLSKAENIKLSRVGEDYLLGKLEEKTFNVESFYKFQQIYEKHKHVIDSDIQEILLNLGKQLKNLLPTKYTLNCHDKRKEIEIEHKKIIIASIFANLRELHGSCNVPIFPEDKW